MWDILNLFGHAGKFYFYQEKVREFWKLMSLATMHITDTDDSVKLSRTTVALISSRRECSNNFQMLHSSEENLTRIWWLKSASNGFLSLLKMMCKSFLDLPLFVILLRSWGILKTRILSNTVSSLHGDQYPTSRVSFDLPRKYRDTFEEDRRRLCSQGRWSNDIVN